MKNRNALKKSVNSDDQTSLIEILLKYSAILGQFDAFYFIDWYPGISNMSG